MPPDDIEDDLMDDEEDEDDEDLPEFKITELTHKKDDEQASLGHDIVIEERTITNLAEIVAFANKACRPVSFDRCVVERVRLHEASVDISFEDSFFTEKINFDRAVLTGKLDFWYTSFEQEIACGGTVFKEDVSFEECLFRTRANFARAVFEKTVAFTGCDFEGDVIFDHTTFAAGANFSNSTFRAKMSCRNAQFEKRVDLANTIFEHAPDVSDSNLEDVKEAPSHEPEYPQKTLRKKLKKRTEFNPWRELDKASKKTMSRRHLLRGIFRFLPADKEE